MSGPELLPCPFCGNNTDRAPELRELRDAMQGLRCETRVFLEGFGQPTDHGPEAQAEPDTITVATPRGGA